MTAKQTLITLITAALMAGQVMAAGEATTQPAASPKSTSTTTLEKREVCTTTYGGARECKTVEIPQEKIVVETGIVENITIAVALLISGYLVMLLAKRYEIIK